MAWRIREYQREERTPIAIAGALIGKAIGAFGKKPVVPDLPAISPSQVQQQTIAGNLAALPSAQRLASAINLFGRQELEAAVPGAANIIQTGTKQLQSFLRGELPESDLLQRKTRSAEQAFAGGFGGTGKAGALEARDIGQGVVDQIKFGLTSADRWLSSARQAGGAFDVSGLLFSPDRMLAFQFDEREAQFQRNLMAAQVAAAPDPANAALGREIDRFFNTAASAGMMAAGGGFGGAGGAAGTLTSQQATQSGLAAFSGAGAITCWVAREVFGERSLNWRMFRAWLLDDAPKWLRWLYIRHGARFASWIRNKPRLKSIIRKWMESKIERKYGITA